MATTFFGFYLPREYEAVHLAFPIRGALRPELSWTHYRRLPHTSDADACTRHMNECAESHWSTRQPVRQINTMRCERLLAPMAERRREFRLRVRPARKGNMRRLSHGWLAGSREICIDPVPAPLAYGGLRLRGYLRDKDGTWLDETPDGNDYSNDVVRHAVMDDVLCG